MFQPIAQPAPGISAWLHSPVSGEVIAIEPRPAPHRLGAPTLSIVIANDGRDERFDNAAGHRFVRTNLADRSLRAHRARRHRRSRWRGVSDREQTRKLAMRERPAAAAQWRRVRALYQLRRNADARARRGHRVRRTSAAPCALRAELHDRNRRRCSASAGCLACRPSTRRPIPGFVSKSCRPSIPPVASGN